VLLLIIPLSITLIKYYPYLAKQYGAWNGVAEISGALRQARTMLGNVCLVSGCFLSLGYGGRAGPSERNDVTKQIILLNVAFSSNDPMVCSISLTASTLPSVSCDWLPGDRCSAEQLGQASPPSL